MEQKLFLLKSESINEKRSKIIFTIYNIRSLSENTLDRKSAIEYTFLIEKSYLTDLFA